MSTLFDQLARENQPWSGTLPDRPPGMVGDDVALYRLYLQQPPTPITVAFFNVRLAPPEPPELASADPFSTLARALEAPRADMIHQAAGRWIITEFHGQAAMGQLGRAIAYPLLLATAFPHDQVVETHVVAYTYNRYTLPLFHRFGTRTYQLPAPGELGALRELTQES